jgi:hypothetical protein
VDHILPEFYGEARAQEKEQNHQSLYTNPDDLINEKDLKTGHSGQFKFYDVKGVSFKIIK